jgi:predicted nucleic acid-binding protein
VVFDSCVLIDLLSKRAGAKELLDAASLWAISAATRTEVLAGARGSADETLIIALLDEFNTLEVTAVIADMAGALRRQHRLKTVDAIILASALHHGLRLVTRDAGFPKSLGDFILTYP